MGRSGSQGDSNESSEICCKVNSSKIPRVEVVVDRW